MRISPRQARLVLLGRLCGIRFQYTSATPRSIPVCTVAEVLPPRNEFARTRSWSNSGFEAGGSGRLPARVGRRLGDLHFDHNSSMMAFNFGPIIS